MKVCIAGGETRHSARLLLKYDCPFWLLSFFSLTKSTPLGEILKRKKFLILDSGAFSWISPKRKRKFGEMDWDKYVFEYGKFVANHPEIDEYIEMDVDAIVGLEQVEKWRKKLKGITGRWPIVVFHQNRGKDYWNFMVRTYPYVAISGIIKNKFGKRETPRESLSWFVRTAHDNGAKIHGLALNLQKIFFSIPFDSTDSVSVWLTGGYRDFSSYDGFWLKKAKVFKRACEPLEEIAVRETVKLQNDVFRYWQGVSNG